MFEKQINVYVKICQRANWFLLFHKNNKAKTQARLVAKCRTTTRVSSVGLFPNDYEAGINCIRQHLLLSGDPPKELDQIVAKFQSMSWRALRELDGGKEPYVKCLYAIRHQADKTHHEVGIGPVAFALQYVAFTLYHFCFLQQELLSDASETTPPELPACRHHTVPSEVVVGPSIDPQL